MPPQDNFLRPAAKDRMRARDNQDNVSRDRSRSPVNHPIIDPEEGDEDIVVDDEPQAQQQPVATEAGNASDSNISVDVVGDGDSQRMNVAVTSPERVEAVGDENDQNSGAVSVVPMSHGSPRAGYRQGDGVLQPVQQQEQQVVAPLRPKPKSTAQDKGERISLMTNFVKIVSHNNYTHMHNYHVTFEPDVESMSMRRRLFHIAFRSEFEEQHVVFDGMFEAKSSYMTPEVVTMRPVSAGERELAPRNVDTSGINPIHRTYTADPKDQRVYTITIRRTGTMPWENSEMLRVYNINMKYFLTALGFFTVNTSGAYLHPNWGKPVGKDLASLQGFRTSAGLYEDNQVLVQLEFVSKLLQQKNLLQTMNEIRNMGGNPKETVTAQLTDKMIVTNYNKVVYKIIDFNFNLSPQSRFFHKKKNKEITYIEYYKERYDVCIQSPNQPLVLVEPHRKNKKLVKHEDKLKPTESSDIYVIPELCNLAGLTEAQRVDTRLKTDLIKAAQIAPSDRIFQMKQFFKILFNEVKVENVFKKMKYHIDKIPVRVEARVMPQESIGIGSQVASGDVTKWPKVDFATAGFERDILRERIVVAPKFKKLYIIITIADRDNETQLLRTVKTGFEKIGFLPETVEVIRMKEGDSGHHFNNRLKQIQPDMENSFLIILPRQNKDKYDLIKKVSSIEIGHITQVATSKLLLDQRKASGASVKIAIQVAAKMGGEPWFINIPIKETMICGFDTYTDTAKKTKTFGAFVASMNSKYSKWWSAASEHINDDQMSANLRDSLRKAIERWREIHSKFPSKIFIYRDGASDGQLKHIDEVELKIIQKTCNEIDIDIKLAFIIVNKKVGARFYLKRGENFINPIPGTCIDSVVTKADRFDFYLISQSTRLGSIAPTYYNVLFDNTNLSPGNHQLMAFKLCFLYYNWTGTVRVPATCQYAHKLALQCGETLHQVPINRLQDNLHYL